MLDDWFRSIELRISREEYDRLPRHCAYKYEYLGNTSWLTPEPRYGRAMLELGPTEPPAREAEGTGTEQLAEFRIRAMSDGDWEQLAGLMAAAFHLVPPFSALDDATAMAAARDCLRHTRDGGDGPVVRQACFVADGPRAWDKPAGAIVITLTPGGDMTQWEGMRWRQPPPADAVEERLGRPHLTWVFVSPWDAGYGLGSELLRVCAGALRLMGFTELASTFLIGNDRSVMWHWRNGFKLLPHPGSMRRHT